jgi:hypothetical protein
MFYFHFALLITSFVSSLRSLMFLKEKTKTEKIKKKALLLGGVAIQQKSNGINDGFERGIVFMPEFFCWIKHGV